MPRRRHPNSILDFGPSIRHAVLRVVGKMPSGVYRAHGSPSVLLTTSCSARQFPSGGNLIKTFPRVPLYVTPSPDQTPLMSAEADAVGVAGVVAWYADHRKCDSS